MIAELPIYLLFPFAASLLFTFGALFLKRATGSGLSVWTQIFLANLFGSVIFSFFFLLGGEFPGVRFLWQPALIGALYVLGQLLILSAVSIGDVSVATPVASLKVVAVAVFLTLIAGVAPPPAIWIAALLAVAGVFLINFFVPVELRSNVMRTAGLAFGAGCTFALFDVCVQLFSPHWGTGRIAPISYWFVALYSLALLPWVDKPKAIAKARWKALVFGCLLVAVQASLLVYSVSTFGNAASINVVYSLRGLWGVVFAWMLAGYFGGHEAEVSRKTMIFRLAGASLLVTAVVITILGQTSEDNGETGPAAESSISKMDDGQQG